MSWRTHGSYRGLREAEREWLQGFDRDWDTKVEGRSQRDALDHMGSTPDLGSGKIWPRAQLSRLKDIPTPGTQELPLDAKLAQFMGTVVRFTVPKVTHYGWSIHLVMNDGTRTRARFPDYEQAMQAYVALQELLIVISIC